MFPLGEGTLTVLGDGVAAENLNDISLVTLFEAPGLRCLSSGDGEKAVEDAVLASGADVHADVFKAAHHGSSTSNTQAFLDAVRPQAVVVSCGAGQFLRTSPQRGAGRVCKCGGAGLPYRYGGNNHCVCRQGGGLADGRKQTGGGVMYYSVDALENGTARLVDDAGGSAFVPAADLPPGAAQGDVLEHRDGVWSAAPEETKRRKARAALLLQQILERENAPGNGGSE